MQQEQRQQENDGPEEDRPRYRVDDEGMFADYIRNVGLQKVSIAFTVK